MTIVNNLILILIGGAFVVLALYFFLRIRNNMRQGRLARKHVAQRADGLRMTRMLRALGIDRSAYLHRMPLTEVNSSLKNCENCPAPEACDEALKQEQVDANDIDFCPNQERLAEFAARPKSER